MSTMIFAIEGGCFCGAVRYQITGKPLSATMCHCSDCRRAAGAQAVAWVTIPGDYFEWTEGEPECYQSSPPVARTFCALCGTSLTYRSDERENEIDVTTGSLDEPAAWPPTQDYFCRDRLPWVEPSTENRKE